MGNIAAGNLSRMCGLPISRFVGGVNINDIVHRGIAHGKYYRELEMKMCLSEAINIQAPYNFERILYWVLGKTDVRRASTLYTNLLFVFRLRHRQAAGFDDIV